MSTPAPARTPIAHTATHGFSLGAALLAPGLSVATIAMVLGIYERLLGEIKNLLSSKWRTALPWILPLGVGAVAAVAIFARVLSWADDNFPFQTRSLFLGLIVGAIPLLMRTVHAPRAFRVKHWLVLAVGLVAVAALELAHIPEASPVYESLDGALVVRVLLSGFLAAVAMLLPGLSAALVLLLTGAYSMLLHAVSELNLPVIGIFAIGGIVGLAAASRAVSFVLARYVRATYAASIGMVAGSAVVVFPGRPDDWVALVTSLAAFIVGFGVVVAVDRARTARAVIDQQSDELNSTPGSVAASDQHRKAEDQNLG